MAIQKLNTEVILNNFKSTLAHLESDKLSLPDADLYDTIFEDLEADAFAHFHSFTVNKLVEEKLIPENIKDTILALRDKIVELAKNRSVDAYRTDDEWKFIRQEAEKVKAEIEMYQLA
ncbi:MAG: hypothetical protein ACXWEY_04910 [Bacteroidia bacterium]